MTHDAKLTDKIATLEKEILRLKKINKRMNNKLREQKDAVLLFRAIQTVGNFIPFRKNEPRNLLEQYFGRQKEMGIR